MSGQIFSLKKFISNYKQTMLAQYLVSLGAAKRKRRSDEAVNSLQANNLLMVHSHRKNNKLNQIPCPKPNSGSTPAGIALGTL